MKEMYSCYEFEIIKCVEEHCGDVWEYKIYGEGCYPYRDGIIDSDEWFDNENEAREAAKQHIDDLENP